MKTNTTPPNLPASTYEAPSTYETVNHAAKRVYKIVKQVEIELSEKISAVRSRIPQVGTLALHAKNFVLNKINPLGNPTSYEQKIKTNKKSEKNLKAIHKRQMKEIKALNLLIELCRKKQSALARKKRPAYQKRKEI